VVGYSLKKAKFDEEGPLFLAPVIFVIQVNTHERPKVNIGLIYSAVCITGLEQWINILLLKYM
jgi:hypothetical protein